MYIYVCVYHMYIHTDKCDIHTCTHGAWYLAKIIYRKGMEGDFPATFDYQVYTSRWFDLRPPGVRNILKERPWRPQMSRGHRTSIADVLPYTFHHISIEAHTNTRDFMRFHKISWIFRCFIGQWRMLVKWQWPGTSKLLASNSCCSAYSKLGIQYLNGAAAATAMAAPAGHPSADPATTIAPDQKRGHRILSEADVFWTAHNKSRVLSVIQLDNLKWQFYSEIRGHINPSIKMPIFSYTAPVLPARDVTRTKLPMTSRTPRQSRWSSTASMTPGGSSQNEQRLICSFICSSEVRGCDLNTDSCHGMPWNAMPEVWKIKGSKYQKTRLVVDLSVHRRATVTDVRGISSTLDLTETGDT